MFGNETTAYALRIVAAVIKLELAYSPDVMQEAGVPEAYGKQIVTKLSRAGIILSRKGRGNGCGLRMNPERLESPLSEIFSLFAPPRLSLENTGQAGRVLDGLLKGLETRTGSLKVSDLR